MTVCNAVDFQLESSLLIDVARTTPAWTASDTTNGRLP